MISFDVIEAHALDNVICGLKNKLSDADFEYIEEILGEISSLDDGCEYAVSASDGCLLIRVFDGEYFFLFPEAVTENFDILFAINAMRLYSIREEIPLVISEVPAEWMDDVASLFKKVKIAAEDDEGELYTLCALSEIAELCELPTVVGTYLAITPLGEGDVQAYARLCRDADTNMYWGYDYTQDYEDPTDEIFLDTALSEFGRGVCSSFAVRLDGKLIGEALLYAFNLLGGAECAVRLASEYRGRGFGNECVRLICEVAKNIGLNELYATVDIRNKPSVSLFRKHFEFLESNNNTIRFLHKL